MKKEPIFTKEQVQLLADNQYTRRVSETSISFTAEFHRKFIKLKNSGMSNREIFKSCNYDPKMMGIQRMASIARKTKGKNPEDFPDKRPLKSKTPTFDETSDKKAMRQMQHEIKYMRQEIEFLKKIMASGVIESEDD